MKLIVGLGNPGDKYQNTRHNLGFRVVEELMEKMEDGKWKIDVEDGGWKLDKRFKSEIIKTDQMILAKPQTYMNNSGMAVKQLADFYKIPVENIVVIHDDLDLPLGKIKIRQGGAAGGHHGVESVIKYLGTDKFTRVKLGIGTLHSLEGERGKKHFNAEEFVVDEFEPKEQVTAKKIIKESVEVLQMILDKGIEKAQNQYN